MPSMHWALTHNVIPKSAKEILHLKIDFKSCQSILSSEPFTGDLGPIFTNSVFLYLNCLCIYFSLLCWNNKINSFWSGDGFTVAKAKDWSRAVRLGGGWRWLKGMDWFGNSRASYPTDFLGTALVKKECESLPAFSFNLVTLISKYATQIHRRCV